MICLHFLACPVSQSSPIESPHYDIIPKENWEIEQLWEIDNNEEQENLSFGSLHSALLTCVSVSLWVLQSQMPSEYGQRMEMIK